MMTNEQLKKMCEETNSHPQGDVDILQYDEKSYWRREGDGSAGRYCKGCNNRWEACCCEEELEEELKEELKEGFCACCGKQARECLGNTYFCHGCGEEVYSCQTVWHDGEPYCKGCDDSPADEE